MGAKLGRVALWTLAVLGVVLLVAYTAIGVASSRRLNTRYSVDVPPLDVPSDAETVAWGGRLVKTVLLCGHCHGEDLGGGVVFEAPPGKVYAPNLTPGTGSVTKDYTIEDWIRAIRHGVKKDGHGALIMPSTEYARLSERDLTAVMAYLRQLPPINRTMKAPQLSPLGRFLVAIKALPIHAEEIDHHAPLPTAPDALATAEYGRYLASVSCMGCHQADLTGGPIPGLPPGIPAPRSIAAAALKDWSEADFARAVQEGVRPDGTKLNPFMPYESFADMNETEVRAIWAFIHSQGP